MSCPFPACSLEGGMFSSMGSFFLDEEVEVGKSCHPGKEKRRRANLPGMCRTRQSHLVLLGVGYPFADLTPVTVLSPPWRFHVGQRQGWWGCCCPQLVMGRLFPGKHKELPAPAEHGSLQRSRGARWPRSGNRAGLIPRLEQSRAAPSPPASGYGLLG